MAWWLPMLKNVLGIDLRGVTNLAEIRTLLWRFDIYAYYEGATVFG